MSDDGHLYLSARGGVEYAGDSRHSWYDDAHRSVLVLSPRSYKLREIVLDASLDVEGRIGVDYLKSARSRSAHDEDDDEDDNSGEDEIRQRSASHCGVSVVYDFAAQYHHAEETVGGRGDHVVAEKEGNMEPVALMKLSLDKQFLAVQTSDIEVQVIRLTTREKFWIMCKPNAGNRILTDGIVWNVHASTPGSSQDLFLITKMGIEQYRVSIKRRNCALHRSIGVYIHTFWYTASHSVLIISTGSRANEIVPYLLRGSSVEKLPRLVFSSSVGKNDLYLASLYGQVYAVYGDTRSTKLLLYLVERNKVSCTRSLNLLLPPGTALEYSVVDNLLVCHSLDFNVSLAMGT
uniref:Regulator of MON1-CCZ1 complex N-terminal domain-containing protein n=1 Tax=Globisporangium ultimum (strain ATCC 200006 / CBS 805.95 / DAOM BR144) TaxID=431595 RepID=K3X8P4_GLOUD